MTHQTEKVALRISDERQPLVRADRSHTVIGVMKEDIWLGDDLYIVDARGFDGRMHIIDFEVDQGARRAVFKQQAYGTRLKKTHAGRIEDADWSGVEQPLLEGPCPRKVIDVLRNLKEVHCASFAWSAVELQPIPTQPALLVILTKIAARGHR